MGFCLGNGLMGHSCFAVVRALPMAAPAPARKVSDETCHPSAMLEMSPSLSGDTKSWFSAAPFLWAPCPTHSLCRIFGML